MDAGERAWPADVAEARRWQLALRDQVRTVSDYGTLHTIGGVDVSNSRYSPWLHAAAVRLDATTLQELEKAAASDRPPFPYIPGFLSFRETPVVRQALAQLSRLPDLIIVDGHGLAHPRRFGIACHLGVLLDLPTIGCAKKILVGHHEPVGPAVGDRQPLVDKGERIGYAVRTSRRGGPVFVSPGHRVSIEDAVEVVLGCTRGYRLPEPTRLAHLAANDLRRRVETS